MIAANLLPMVYVVYVVFFPIAYPISLVLDYVLGHDGGITLYNRKEIATMMNIQHEEVNNTCNDDDGDTDSDSETNNDDDKNVDTDTDPDTVRRSDSDNDNHIDIDAHAYNCNGSVCALTVCLSICLSVCLCAIYLFVCLCFCLCVSLFAAVMLAESFVNLYSFSLSLHYILQGLGKGLKGGSLHIEEMTIIDGALKFRSVPHIHFLDSVNLLFRYYVECPGPILLLFLES